MTEMQTQEILSALKQMGFSGEKKATCNPKQIAKMRTQLAKGTLCNQPVWKLVKECSKMDNAQQDSLAIIDCSREYTYNQMFEEWDKYARVFSALDITDTNKSRVAIGGAISAETLFSFYGANMTGASVSMFSYPDFLPAGKWKTMIKAENITDLVICDIMVSPELWKELMKEKKKLGLKHIILIHTRLGGPTVGPSELLYDEINYHILKNTNGTVFMDELIEKYADKPIHYGKYKKDAIAVITHTSGTTQGTRKPIPYTSNAVNIIAMAEMIVMATEILPSGMKILVPFDFSSFLCLLSSSNMMLTAGQTLVLSCFGFLHPKFINAIEYYKIQNVFLPCFLLDSWLDRDDIDDVDLSSLISVMTGGSYASPEKMKQYNSFLRKHGYKGPELINGYGMSEVGKQGIVPAKKSKYPDIMGFPNPVENYMIKDDKDGKFYTSAQGERTGTLHITSESMACNKLDGRKLFDYVVINGRNFICTNDLVRVNKDGSLSYAGRSDKYFTNNEGVRFDSGLVETAMSAHDSIAKCAIVPVLEKRIHDTVPVLYVVPYDKGDNPPEVVKEAIKDVYFKQKIINKSVLPSQFIIVDSVPSNSNGKTDIYRITRERLQGTAYNILPISKDGSVKDIKIELAEQLNSIRAGGLPEGMGESSAFNIFDVFNTSSSGAKSEKTKSGTRRTNMNNFFDDDFDFSDFMKLMPMFKDMEQGPFTNFRMPGDFTPMMPPMFYMRQIAFGNMMQMMKYFMDKAEEFKKKYSPDNSKMMDLGGIKVPAEFFRKLLSIEASPESLEQLQKFLDFSFAMLDKKKK